MGKVTYTEEQIVAALRRVEGGTPATEVCRKLGVSEKTSRHNIGDAGMYLGWQQNRQIGGAVSALASRFTRIRGTILLPR